MKTAMKFMLGTAALLVAGSLAAQTATFNQAADWKKNKLVSDGDGALNIASQAMLVSSKRFDIDPAKTYTLKFSVAAPEVADKKTAWVLGGFALYDKAGRPITCLQSAVMPNTQTEVAVGAKKGDSVLIVTDTSKIKKSLYYGIVAGAKKDLSDLPNRNLIGIGIKDVAKDGESWKITLARPLVKDVKAGTSIRVHYAGGYLYTAGSKYIGKNWVVMAGKIKGIRKGVWAGNVWPAGAAKAEFIILANWNKQKTPIQIKEASLTIE